LEASYRLIIFKNILYSDITIYVRSNILVSREKYILFGMSDTDTHMYTCMLTLRGIEFVYNKIPKENLFYFCTLLDTLIISSMLCFGHCFLVKCTYIFVYVMAMCHMKLHGSATLKNAWSTRLYEQICKCF
jgi:hypothetical protein